MKTLVIRRSDLKAKKFSSMVIKETESTPKKQDAYLVAKLLKQVLES